jgi:hypothetical protein
MEFENQYLTYEEYQELGGTLEESPFNILEFQAQKIVDEYTFGRLKNLSEQIMDVKLCILHLMTILEGYQKMEASDKIGLASVNTDGYSESYTTDINTIVKGKRAELRTIVNIDLAECKLPNGTPYLYLGR